MVSIFQKKNAVLEKLIGGLEEDLDLGLLSDARDDFTELKEVYMEMLDDGTLSKKQQTHYDELLCAIAIRLCGCRTPFHQASE